MLAIVSPGAYWAAVVVAAAGCALLCSEARRRPGPWTKTAARVLGLILAADAVMYTTGKSISGWSPSTSLPLALCDVAALVAAAACWWPRPTLVELTYFWGLAGTLQAVATPDVTTPFPHLAFIEYLVGHVGIVVVALFLVIGLRYVPRPGSVLRVFAITAMYTAFIGVVDATTGADYMFLRRPPSEWTLLKVLGPWPWYIVSAAGVALILLLLLDSPFWVARHRTHHAL
ncbi:MAG TPA: TIGR02206 family membrane protein [Acidimicrobiales bacterium]|nr:TIGR02206 family membrane protein [Acidimicrobiales bacterium]